MTRVDFEPMIPAFEMAQRVHASDRAAPVIANSENYCPEYFKIYGSSVFALSVYFGKTNGTNGTTNKKINPNGKINACTHQNNQVLKP
jgi:hypothetical protein